MAIPTSRREFMQASALIGAGLWIGGSSKASGKPRSPNERVQYGVIGCGGKGKSDSADAGKLGQVIGMCDVDAQTLAQAAKNPAFKNPQTFADYREMLDKLGDKLDGVTVSTPDHNHAPATAIALKQGIACHTQKPLTHCVWEARRLAELAEQYDVPTQMGNQGTANDGLREAAAIIKGGYLGNVTEAHVFTNRPIWEQGNPRPASVAVPDHLSWNLWLGPAPLRPYAKGVYHNFAWRGWWDFGTGALGDMACHTFNMPYMALDLKDPVSIQATCTGHNGDSYPQKSVITFEFPSNERRGPVKAVWYDGGNVPSNDLIFGKELKGGDSPRGVIIKGDKATLYTWNDYSAEFAIYDNDGQEIDKPEVEYEKSPGHFVEFHQSITGERKRAVSNFEGYAGKLTETILLGNLAVWAAAPGEGPKVEWDSANLSSPSHPELATIIHNEYRDGYEV